MVRINTLNLDDHFEKFVTDQVTTGHYDSASAAVCSGLKQLESTESKVNTLRNMLEEGEKSGIADYSYDEFISELNA